LVALLLDLDHAVRALATMVPVEDNRRKLLAEVTAIVNAAGSPTPETARRLQGVAETLGEGAGRRVDEAPRLTRKPGAAVKRS
jgi:hypothetical protein